LTDFLDRIVGTIDPEGKEAYRSADPWEVTRYVEGARVCSTETSGKMIHHVPTDDFWRRGRRSRMWFQLPLEFQSLFVFRSSHSSSGTAQTVPAVPRVPWSNIAVELSHVLVRFNACYLKNEALEGVRDPLNDRGGGSAGAIICSQAKSRSHARRAAVWLETWRVLTQLMPVGLDSIAVAPILQELWRGIAIRRGA
jgi:hypothetical protein